MIFQWFHKSHTLWHSRKDWTHGSPNFVLSHQCWGVNDLNVTKHPIKKAQMYKLQLHRLCTINDLKTTYLTFKMNPEKTVSLSFLALNSHKDSAGVMSTLCLVACYLSAAVAQPLACKTSPVIPAIQRCSSFDLTETCVHWSSHQEQELSQELVQPPPSCTQASLHLGAHEFSLVLKCPWHALHTHHAGAYNQTPQMWVSIGNIQPPQKVLAWIFPSKLGKLGYWSLFFLGYQINRHELHWQTLSFGWCPCGPVPCCTNSNPSLTRAGFNNISANKSCWTQHHRKEIWTLEKLQIWVLLRCLWPGSTLRRNEMPNP